MAKIQSSGEIKLSDIRAQVGLSSRADFSLDGAENGDTQQGYARINLCSPSRPSDSDPVTFSEWYNYDHAAGCTNPGVTTVYSNYTSDLCNAVPTGNGENTAGTTTFSYDADYIILTYQFTNGADLDTRTRIVTPDVGQNLQSDYVGFGFRSQWPMTVNANVAYLRWGGDNQGTGFESVLINLVAFRAAYPTATSIVIDCRAWWYGSVGSNPVKVAATMYKGGTITGPTSFTFGNSGYTSTSSVESVSKQITLFQNNKYTSGARIATLTYNLVNNTGVFNSNDTTTPTA